MLKDFLLQAGVVVTLVLGVINLYFNLKSAKRTSFINTVTSERVKWISITRQNVAEFCALHDLRKYHPNDIDRVDLQRQIGILTTKLRLQLNPNDHEDMEIERLIARFPSRVQDLAGDEYDKVRAALVTATQNMLKREWDKVKDEATRGDIGKSFKSAAK